MINRSTLSKFGIGAWGLGGFAKYDINNPDDEQINALGHTLQKGINFVEVNFWNSEGHSVEIIHQAIKKSKIPRDKLFFVQAIYNYSNPTINDVKAEFERCLEKFNTRYIDSLEFPLTAYAKYGFRELVKLTDQPTFRGADTLY